MANTRASIPFNAQRYRFIRLSGRTEQLSVIVLQLLIQLASGLAITKAVFRNFVQFSSLEVFSDVLAVDLGFRRGNPENLAKELERSFPVALVVGHDLAHVEMALRAKSPGIQNDVARNRDSVNCASDVDVGEIEGFAVEGYKTLGANLTDVIPEICQQFSLVRLAIRARPFELDPVNSDTND